MNAKNGEPLEEDLVHHRIKVLETRVDNHSERLDKLEKNDVALSVQVENLCKYIKDLISTMKWFIGITISVFSIIITILGWYIASNK